MGGEGMGIFMWTCLALLMVCEPFLIYINYILRKKYRDEMTETVTMWRWLDAGYPYTSLILQPALVIFFMIYFWIIFPCELCYGVMVAIVIISTINDLLVLKRIRKFERELAEENKNGA